MRLGSSLARGQKERFLVGENVGCVPDRRLNVLPLETWVGVQQVGLGGSFSEFAEQQFDRDPRAANDGLAHHHLRIDLNTLSHGHDILRGALMSARVYHPPLTHRAPP
jgi:hypothetical protein